MRMFAWHEEALVEELQSCREHKHFFGVTENVKYFRYYKITPDYLHSPLLSLQKHIDIVSPPDIKILCNKWI